MIPLSELDKLRKICSDLEELVFKNECDFLNRFCPKSAAEIVKLSFDSSKVRFTYYNEDGQHFSDDIKWEDFQNFIWSLKSHD